MKRNLTILLLRIFGRLPRGVRRMVVRAVSPKYTVGSLCLVERDDGAVLLVRHSYNRRWGTVGGLCKPGEPPDVAAVREAGEEAGIEVEVVGEPAVVVLADLRRVDIVYRARLSRTAVENIARPVSAEILEVGWFHRDNLPHLSADTIGAWMALARQGGIDPPG